VNDEEKKIRDETSSEDEHAADSANNYKNYQTETVKVRLLPPQHLYILDKYDQDERARLRESSQHIL
jgi:hypothetical protein